MKGESPYTIRLHILEWLEARFPNPPLLPHADIERRLAAKKRQMLGERLMEIAQESRFSKCTGPIRAPWIERQTKEDFWWPRGVERLYANRHNEQRCR